jgi:hypothetical protein
VDSGKVALLGGMLAVGSALAMAVHSIGSSAVVSLHLRVGSLYLKLRPLHLKLRALQIRWHLWSVHLWWLEELVRLREVRPNVASRGLSME